MRPVVCVLLVAALAAGGCVGQERQAPRSGATDDDEPATHPCAPAGAREPPLHTPEELALALESVKGPAEELPCVLAAVAPRINTWNGSAYSNLTGRAELASKDAQGHLWNVFLAGGFDDSVREDLYSFDVRLKDGAFAGMNEGGAYFRGAYPSGRLAEAHDIVRADPAWEEIRERAPHVQPNSTRWAEGGRMVVFYSSYPPGGGGIPEHPFAHVTVDVEGHRVEEVDRSPWWNHQAGGDPDA